MASHAENPYRSPSPVSAAEPRSDTTDGCVELLVQTRPWVRFISVVLFLVAAAMIFLGAAIDLGGLGPQGAGRLPPGVGLAIYSFMGILFYIIPGMFLWQYASRISDLQFSRNIQVLELALDAQRRFWKYLGLTMAIIIGLYVLCGGLAVLFYAIAATG